MAKLELEQGIDVLLLETGDALLLEGGVIDLQVAASADDAFELESDGSMNIIDTEVVMQASEWATGRYWGAIRWASGSLPPMGSTITAAYIEMYNADADYDDANGKLHFQDAESPAQFTTTTNDITNRPLTTAYASWVEATGEGWVQTPSLVTPLQEIVDSYSPTALVLILKPNTIESPPTYEQFFGWAWDYGDHSYAPKLHIEYTAAAGWKGSRGFIIG
jgi:hypothetical protein